MIRSARCTSFIALALLLAGAPLAAEPPADPTAGPLTIDQAIATAMARNARLKASDSAITAARYSERSNMARFKPMLRVTGNIMVWDSALELSFVDSGGGGDPTAQLPPPETPYEQAFAGMLQSLGGTTTIRDQVTGEIGASIIQPLSPLITVGEAQDLFDLGIETERIKKRRLEADIKLQTATAYFRLLQAQTVKRTADDSVRVLEAQLERINHLLARGVVGENDRLALEVALAARRQDVIRAQTNIAVARAGLALSMGLSIDSPVAPVAIETRSVPVVVGTLEEAYEAALRERQDVEELEAGVKAADYALTLEKAKHTPSLSAIASYTHSEGSSFAESDSFFVGLFLEWNAFEWGATSYGVDRAAARVSEVQHHGEALREAIRFEVKRTRLELEASIEALAVAEGAVELAKRSLELETKRLEAGDSTATDVLATETAYRQAQHNQTAAYYQTLVANVDYQKAIGAPLGAATLIPGGTDAPTP